MRPVAAAARQTTRHAMPRGAEHRRRTTHRSAPSTLPLPAGGITAADVAALRLQGVRHHAVTPRFGPELGIWIAGLFVTLDLTPPRPVVQCVHGGSASDPEATVRGRYVARDDADAIVVFNACVRLWTRALPVECTLRAQRAQRTQRRPARDARPARAVPQHAAA